MTGRVRTLTTFKTGDPDFDRYQEHVKQTLTPVLDNPVLSAADFRWNEAAGADPTQTPTFALQYRSAGSTWNTIATFTSAGQIAQPAWTAATLAGTWAVGGGRTAAYFKDTAGFIHLKGLVNGGGAALVFTLPTGYRPSQIQVFSTDHNGAFGRINIQTDGTVSSDVGGFTNVSLDGITFDTRS